MRFGHALAAAAAAALACGLLCRAEPPIRAAADDRPGEHPYLRLELRRVGDGPHYPWEPLWLMPVVTNISVSQTTAFLPPGDGSFQGRREPAVRWSCWVRDINGSWRPVELPGWSGCGTHDPEWRDEIELLPPGRSYTCRPPFAPRLPPLDEPTRIRIGLEYVYTATPPRSIRVEPPLGEAPLGAMEGVAPFRLVAEPIEVAIEAPLKLGVRQRRQVPIGVEFDPADCFEIHLINVSNEAVAIGSNPAAELHLSFTGLRCERGQQPRTREPGMVRVIGPGERVALLGHGVGKGLHAPCRIERPADAHGATLRLRAFYQRPGWVAPVPSPEIEVEIPPLPPPPAPAPPPAPPPQIA